VTEPGAPFESYQYEVYLAGLAGQRPELPFSIAGLEREAERTLPREAFGYVAGAAGSEDTVRANLEAFRRWRIVPRMLRDVSARETSVELFGRRLAAPLLLAPVGVLELAHPEADLAAARAAAAEGVPMIFSNQASTPMEACAEAMGDGPRWFQLYWSTSNELVESFVGRAEACGCEAIVLTLDTTIPGWRTADLDLAYLPFLRGKGIAQYTSDPVFQRLVEADSGAAPTPPPRPSPRALGTLIQLVRSHPDRFWPALRSGRARKAVERFVQIYSRPSLTWDDLPFLRERTQLPILLKGILDPDDAKKALDHGMDGVIVSNHGGRQVDGAIASIDALPGVAEAVSGRVPVLLDSGVRGGADMFKALALGASAVCIGRPYLWGLAAGGENGVRDVIRNFVADFDLTMGLAGNRSAAEIERDALVRAP
jgi:lactate 2-monooxygenase